MADKSVWDGLSEYFFGEANPYGKIVAQSSDISDSKLHYFQRNLEGNDIVIASKNPQIQGLTDVEFSQERMLDNFQRTVDNNGIAVYSDSKRLHEALENGGYYRLDEDGLAIIERLDLSTNKIPRPSTKPTPPTTHASEPKPEPETRTATPKASTHFNHPETKQSGLSYTVPKDIDKLIKDATHGDPISYEIMVQVLGSESGFKNKASGTGALGIGQVVGPTAREYLYKNKTLFAPETQAIIEANIDKKHNVKPGGSRDAINTLTKQPEVAIILAREIMRSHTISGEKIRKTELEGRISWLKNPKNPNPGSPERIERLQQHLDRPPNATDVKTYYMCGAFGGAGLLVAHADINTQNHKAADYLGKTEKGGVKENVIRHVGDNNKNVFYKQGNEDNPRTIPEYMNYMGERVGNDIALASDLTRSESTRVASAEITHTAP